MGASSSRRNHQQRLPPLERSLGGKRSASTVARDRYLKSRRSRNRTQEKEKDSSVGGGDFSHLESSKFRPPDSTRRVLEALEERVLDRERRLLERKEEEKEEEDKCAFIPLLLGIHSSAQSAA